MRGWAEEHGLGRRIGGGTWSVGRVALAMFLDGEMRALRPYHAGDSTDLVAKYFDRVGLADMVDAWLRLRTRRRICRPILLALHQIEWLEGLIYRSL